MRTIEQTVLAMAATKGIKLAADELQLVKRRLENAYLDSIITDVMPFDAVKQSELPPSILARPETQPQETNGIPAALRPVASPSFSGVAIEPEAPEFNMGPFKGTDPRDALVNAGNKLTDSLPVVGSAKRLLAKYNLRADVATDKAMLEYKRKF